MSENIVMKFIVGIIVAIIGLTVYSIIAAPPVEAATFQQDGSVLYLDGNVVKDDADRLVSVVEASQDTPTPIKTLYMHSPGGVAIEGYRLGYAINYYKLHTIVGYDKVCFSACATAFLGGTTKTVAGVLGFHVAWSDQNKGSYSDGMKAGQGLATVDSTYLFNMGYTIQLPYIVTQVTDFETFLVLSVDDLKMFEMKDKEFTNFLDLPKGWIADRVYSPLRMALLLGGH